MSSTSTNQTTHTRELARLLHSGKVVVRYNLSRFDRSTNTQSFYGEVLSLHYAKEDGKYLVHHLVFGNEVTDFYVKTRSENHYDPANLLDLPGAEKRIEQIVATWKNRPRDWRSSQPFAGVLSIGEERISLPPTNSHFQFYHGHIEATLWGLVCIAYREERSADAFTRYTQYNALLNMHAKFGSFAGNSCIGRALNAFKQS